MDAGERLSRQALLQTVDRIPTIGGWILGTRQLAEFGGNSPEVFLQDPFAGVVRAHLALKIDGMVSPVVPTELEQDRAGHVFLDEAFPESSPEDLLAAADRTSPEELLRQFDPVAYENETRAFFERTRWGGLEPIPNFWDIGGHYSLYTEFGIRAFYEATALYPEAVEHIWRSRSAVSRQKAAIVARLVKELRLVPMFFCGEDLCDNHGPMCSPQFLIERYLPTVQMSIEPLVESGVRVIHHCDGDVRPLFQAFLDLGFRGFQGFQYECGVQISQIHAMRTAFGEPPLIWAGMSVSRTLPLGTPEDVRAEIDGFVRETSGGIGLFVHTSNVSGVDVPAQNLRAGYLHAAATRLSSV